MGYSLPSTSSSPQGAPHSTWQESNPNVLEAPRRHGNVSIKRLNGNFGSCVDCRAVGGRAIGGSNRWSLSNFPCIPRSEYHRYRVDYLSDDTWDVLQFGIMEEDGTIKQGRKMFVCKVCKFRNGDHYFVCRLEQYGYVDIFNIVQPPQPLS
ncbi:hypothetical protein M427DRAFT_45878 [Gonapodya prolifera JEL478]|uniref:Uncharacterized protein n=1 Tax=Gonapodya prolifera (strain JEL478) TaxID=1344416 RepID=A0A139A927_GONPJ|nr:hypothetical protein M427DRAFT_45878 [Gonapodya prolifera JEL478]|eukprot:KXS13331.1 hypothetical protein M427DRAFT_45878 [Gonapodya prolifera JEL478]